MFYPKCLVITISKCEFDRVIIKYHGWITEVRLKVIRGTSQPEYKTTNYFPFTDVNTKVFGPKTNDRTIDFSSSTFIISKHSDHNPNQRYEFSRRFDGIFIPSLLLVEHSDSPVSIWIMISDKKPFSMNDTVSLP